MNEDDLRRRFVELRGEERAAIPAFHSIRRARHQRLVPRRALIGAGALVLIMLIAILAAIANRGPREFTADDLLAARRIDSWHAPTDTLLRTPGHDLLVTTPDIPSTSLPKGAPR
jgi:hypothetical protein